jgi:hypothetical protein
MFSKSSSSVTIDLLFNLLLTFVCLFFLAFILVNEPTEEESSDVTSDAQFLISMSWDVDCDIDLWIKLPNGERVYYGRRQSGPVHLDLDVVGFRHFRSESTGSTVVLEGNQEIVSIRGVLEGTYIINAHYFGGRNNAEEVKVQVHIQDVKRRNTLWAGEVLLNGAGHEAHVVKLEVSESSGAYPSIGRIVEDQPELIVGR